MGVDIETILVTLFTISGRDRLGGGVVSRGVPGAHFYHLTFWIHGLSLCPSGPAPVARLNPWLVIVWLSRQRRNPAATDTYQSQAQTQSEGRVAVCQSERSAQLNFISSW
jgi:hypothetical protein